MKRKIYDKLLEWKKNHKGDTALLIEGARRIGKSYIVEEFARKEYESYIWNFTSGGNLLHARRKARKPVPWSYSTKYSSAPVPVQPSSTWSQTGVMTILRLARLFPLRRMSRTSCCHPKNMPLKCFRWTLRNSCGQWVMKC